MNKIRINGITPASYFFGDKKVSKIWLGTADPEAPELIYSPDTTEWKFAFTSNPNSKKRFDDNTVLFVDTIKAKQVLDKGNVKLFIHTGTEPDILKGENGDICILQSAGYTDGTSFNMKEIETAIVVDNTTDENIHSADNEIASDAPVGTLGISIRDSYANRWLTKAFTNNRRN